MPKETALTVRDTDGSVRTITGVHFTDAEWADLQKFVLLSQEVAETPLVHEVRHVSISLSYDFTTNTQAHTVTLPPKAEIHALLHVMRPFVLTGKDEPCSFNRICNILVHRLEDLGVRAAVDGQKDLFSGKEFQQQATLMALSADKSVVMNSEGTFQLWLNAYEYHKDADKQERLADLPLPFEPLRGIFISMMQDRAMAVLNISDFVRFLADSKPEDGRLFQL